MGLCSEATVVVGNADLAQGTVITTIHGVDSGCTHVVLKCPHDADAAQHRSGINVDRAAVCPLENPGRGRGVHPHLKESQKPKGRETAGFFSLCFERRFFCKERNAALSPE